jgi:hypothetical protein
LGLAHVRRSNLELPVVQGVDEKRTVLQIVDKIMRMSHGDRWKYTAKEYDQYLKGKNPHGLKAPAARAPAKRRGAIHEAHRWRSRLRQ